MDHDSMQLLNCSLQLLVTGLFSGFSTFCFKKKKKKWSSSYQPLPSASDSLLPAHLAIVKSTSMLLSCYLCGVWVVLSIQA